MKNVQKAHILLILVAFVNGANYSIAKILMPLYIHPSAIILIRGISACIFFGIACKGWTSVQTIDKKDYLRILICSFCGIAANQLLFFNGLNYTTPINAAVLTLMTPVIVTILSLLFLGTLLNKYNWAGLFIAAISAFLLISGKGLSFSPDTFKGDMMIIANGTFYGIFMVTVPPLMKKYDAFLVLFLLFTLALPMVLPFSLFHLSVINWAAFPAIAWFSICFVVLGATIFVYASNIWALKYISPASAGVYIYLIPMLATFFAILLGKDTLTLAKSIYTLFILIGVYLAGVKTSPKEEKRSLEEI